MHDDDCSHPPDDRLPRSAPGEFDQLLREIEKESVPDRLLELALQLQAALLEQRKRREKEESGSS